MHALFVMRTAGFLRNFEALLRELAAREHEVTVAIEHPKTSLALERARAELEATGQVRFATAPDLGVSPRHRLAVQARLGLDYLRYLGPRYRQSPKLRVRAAQHAPAPVVWLLRRPALRRPRPVRVLARALRAFEVSAPVSPGACALLEEHRPDVLLLTPLVELGAPQVDYLRAARRRGIPSCHAVASWDNLTVKGGLREWPDLVAVWNDAQVREAAELHGLPADRVTAVGAHTYDHWFSWRAERDRTAFCRQAGLPDDRPYLLYLCSSPFIAPDEATFVRDWLTRLRTASVPAVRQVAVLVRPHPQHADQWRDVHLDGLGPAVVWPRGGADPVERSSRRDFFESMEHAAAVTGINTSALIESAIVGREVLTVLDSRYATTQSGTLHFGHLAESEQGVLTVARDHDEHHRQLARVLGGEDVDADRRRRFVERFVRPQGRDRASAPRFADALEALVARGPTARPPDQQPVSPLAIGLRTAWASPLPALAVGALTRCTRRARKRG